MRLPILGAILVFTAASAAAQNPATVTVTMAVNGNTTKGTANPATLIDVGADGAVVTIDCSTTNNCDKVDAFVDQKQQTISDVTAKSAKIKVAQADVSTAGSDLLINVNNTPAVTVKLRSVGGGGGNGGGGGAKGCSTVDPTYVPQRDKRGREMGANGRADAHFAVTPGGSILQYPDQPVDENDRVFVHVQGEPDEVATIEVARTSATRAPGAHFVGEGQNVTNFKSKGCVERVFQLGDFAPGEGTVEMFTTTSGQKVTKGSFKFTVDTLYSGIIGFGPMFSRGAADETFKLQAKGDKKVITASEEGARNVVYAVSYTYYMWGRRDLEKPTNHWYEHVNPTLGISVKNMTDHALVGASVDLGQFIITVGSHVAHVNRLTSKSGLSDGSEFAGTADDIPQSKRWQSHAFVGVSVDIRAAAALLKTLATGGGS